MVKSGTTTTKNKTEKSEESCVADGGSDRYKDKLLKVQVFNVALRLGLFQ